MNKYRSNEELLNHIISKGIIVKNKKDVLMKFERYNYYSIINTYKDVFKNGNNYIKGVNFNEIFALYEFDKNLKIIFLKYILEIEIVIKSLISNTISEKYGIEEYLNSSCFDSSAKEDSIKNLISYINEEIEKNYGRHSAITHYKNKYGFIPPFVLVKIMTIGQISRYYGLLKQEDRQKISKYFKMSDKILKQILINLTLVRNISAHNDRLYTFHSKFFISFHYIDNKYQISDKSTNLYMLMKCMGILLDKKDYKQLRKQVNSEISKLGKKLKVINKNNILDIIGFPSK